MNFALAIVEELKEEVRLREWMIIYKQKRFIKHFSVREELELKKFQLLARSHGLERKMRTTFSLHLSDVILVSLRLLLILSNEKFQRWFRFWLQKAICFCIHVKEISSSVPKNCVCTKPLQMRRKLSNIHGNLVTSENTFLLLCLRSQLGFLN